MHRNIALMVSIYWVVTANSNAITNVLLIYGFVARHIYQSECYILIIRE